MTRKITVGQFKNDPESVEGEKVYLKTFNGWQEVDYVTYDGWAHCPRDNGGYGRSYMVPSNETLVVGEKPQA